MKYEEMSFRAVYHDFCVLPMVERIKKLITNFPTTDEANGVLTYGYYDELPHLIRSSDGVSL